jgi:hypothetical protein
LGTTRPNRNGRAGQSTTKKQVVENLGRTTRKG